LMWNKGSDISMSNYQWTHQFSKQ